MANKRISNSSISNKTISESRISNIKSFRRMRGNIGTIAVGGVVSEFSDNGRPYIVHKFSEPGTFTFSVRAAGNLGQQAKYVVSNGSFNGVSGNYVENSFFPGPGSYTVVVNSGGSVAVSYPKNDDILDIPFNQINPLPIQATGGEISDFEYEGTYYRRHVFRSTSTFTVNSLGNLSSTPTIDFLIVGGGGSGSAPSNTGGSGGGGASALATDSTYSSQRIPRLTVSEQSYPITVGAGGAGVSAGTTNGNNGQSSSAFGHTALGGYGAQGNRGGQWGGGFNGGSGYLGSLGNYGQGGGGSSYNQYGPEADEVGYYERDGTYVFQYYRAGWGGKPIALTPYKGYPNYYSSWGPNRVDSFFAAGGGGGTSGSFSNRQGSGGSDSFNNIPRLGGDGVVTGRPPNTSNNGNPNTGSGGGGAGAGTASGSGGSGIVMVRYEIPAP